MLRSNSTKSLKKNIICGAAIIVGVIIALVGGFVLLASDEVDSTDKEDVLPDVVVDFCLDLGRSDR